MHQDDMPPEHPADAETTPEPSPRRSSRRIVWFALAVVVVLALTALLAFGLANRAPVTGRSGETRIAKPAPPMNMLLYDRGSLTPADYAGMPVVVNFWASWCGPCRQEAPIFERLSREYAERGVLFIGVNIQDAETDAEAYLREYDITYPNGMDAGGGISVDYGVIGIPVTFFINRDGIVQRRWAGVMRETQLRTWIDELVLGTAPTGDAQGTNPEGYEPLR